MNYKDFKDLMKICLAVGFFIIFIFTLIGIPVVISDYYEVKAFNRIHGTNYTFNEWFFAEMTIKDYHLGEVKNYNINLNKDIIIE